MEGNLMNQNDRQVGGDHYKKLEIQTWDYIIANNRAHFRSINNDQSKWFSCYKKLSGFDYISLSKGKIDLSRIYKIKN